MAAPPPADAERDADADRTATRPLPPAVVASKGSTSYQVHTYPTKIPPSAIEPFILASTEPGGVVLDPFCGSGMTGLAAVATGRQPLLSDLSPGAVHLARHHTVAADPAAVRAALGELGEWMAARALALYSSSCPACGDSGGVLRHVVWSDVHRCGGCAAALVVWDFADESGSAPRTLTCPGCGHPNRRHGVAPAGSVPVSKAVACTACAGLQRGPVDAPDRALLDTLSREPVVHWMPDTALGDDREMYRRSALQLRGVRTVADLWTHRSKLALSELWHRLDDLAPDVAGPLRLAFTNTAWHASRMRRYNAFGGQRPLTGTLYIPQLVAEANVFAVFRHQVEQVVRFYESHPARGRADVPDLVARQSSATDLSWLADGSVDYVFTDPPFGSHLFYADCNVVWESWLGSVTDPRDEILVNRSLPAEAGGKSVGDYERLLTDAFREIARVLRPGGRASVVFHNSDDQVWAALLNAAHAAGLVQSDVSLLDKTQRSMKGYKGRSGVELVGFYDLVITFVAGSENRPPAHLNGAGDLALDIVTKHLDALPPAGAAPVRERSLEYLYSLAVAGVISAGVRPEGLSLRALNGLIREHLDHDARGFHTR